MTDIDPLVSEVKVSRTRFLELVAGLRPDLHRYCARMTGSVSDGEDIVQETLARAYYALPEMESRPELRSWLFHIAHRRAIDHLRRYDRKMGRSLDELGELAAEVDAPDDALAREEAVLTALARFLELPPFPRSCVILKDVLGHSVDEIARFVDQSPAAVKAAIHRGRLRLRELRVAAVPSPKAQHIQPIAATVARYVALFNARDWDGVRALLADDVRLDLVSRSQRSGRRDVGGYVSNYARADDWFLVPARLDGADIVAAFRGAHEAQTSYFIELEVADGRVTRIKDFRYVPYICVDALIELADPPAAASFARRA